MRVNKSRKEGRMEGLVRRRWGHYRGSAKVVNLMSRSHPLTSKVSGGYQVLLTPSSHREEGGFEDLVPRLGGWGIKIWSGLKKPISINHVTQPIFFSLLLEWLRLEFNALISDT